jgi:hypothetical protein
MGALWLMRSKPASGEGTRMVEQEGSRKEVTNAKDKCETAESGKIRFRYEIGL